MGHLPKPLKSENLRVTATDESFGRCACCGHVTRCIWGWIDAGEAVVAAYWVRWTENHIADHGASIDLCIGTWSEATPCAERALVSLLYRETEKGDGMYMVTDADAARLGPGGLATTALRRDEVIGTPLAPQVFALIDAIHLQDKRLGAPDDTRGD